MTNTPKFTNIMGQDHMLAYINKAEADMLKRAGGAGVPVGPAQIPAYFIFGGSDGFGGLFSGDSSSNSTINNNTKKNSTANTTPATTQGIVGDNDTGSNSIAQFIANALTPNDGTKYINGKLVEASDNFDPTGGNTNKNAVSSTKVNADSDVINAYSQMASGLKQAGVMNVGGKQRTNSEAAIPGNPPIISVTGNNGEVDFSVDDSLYGSSPTLATNSDGTLFVPYDGKDAHSIDASTFFPGETNPLLANGQPNPNYNMSLDLQQNGQYSVSDALLGIGDDTTTKVITGDPFTTTLPGNQANTLNVLAKDKLLKTGDDSDMLTHLDGGGYTSKNNDKITTAIATNLINDNDLLNEETKVNSVFTCPTPDMPILMADRSTKPAGDIRVGDSVYTAHEKTMSWGVHEVTRAETVESSVVKLFFTDNEITCSPNHKIYRGDIQDWVEVKDLEYGDRVVTQEGTIEFLSRIPQDRGEVVILTIKDAHTYICGGILSHNKSPKEVIPLNNNDDDDDDDPVVPIVNQALLDARARRDAAYLAQQGNITNTFGFANDGYYDGLKENYLNDSEGIFKTAYDDAERGLYDVFKSAGLLTQSGVDQSVGKLEGALGTEEGRLGGLSDEYRSANKGFVEGGRGSINSGLDALKFFSEDVAEVNTQTDNINAYDVAGLSSPYKTPKDQDIADFFTDFAKRKFDPSYNVDPSKTASSKAMRIGAASVSQPSQLLGIKSPYSGKSVKVIS